MAPILRVLDILWGLPLFNHVMACLPVLHLVTLVDHMEHPHLGRKLVQSIPAATPEAVTEPIPLDLSLSSLDMKDPGTILKGDARPRTESRLGDIPRARSILGFRADGIDSSQQNEALTRSIGQLPATDFTMQDSPFETTRSCEVGQPLCLGSELPHLRITPGSLRSLDGSGSDEEPSADSLSRRTRAVGNDPASATLSMSGAVQQTAGVCSELTRTWGKDVCFPGREYRKDARESTANVPKPKPFVVNEHLVHNVIGERDRVMLTARDDYPSETTPEEGILRVPEDVRTPTAVDSDEDEDEPEPEPMPGGKGKLKWLWNMMAFSLVLSGLLTLSYVEGKIPRWILILAGEPREGIESRSPVGSFDIIAPPSDSETDYGHLPDLVRLRESSRFSADTDSDETSSRESNHEDDVNQRPMWDTRQVAPERLVFHPMYGVVPAGSAKMWDQETAREGMAEEPKAEVTQMVPKDPWSTTDD